MDILLMKLAPRIPMLIARALAGDGSAALTLGAMGVCVVVKAVKGDR